MATREPFSPIAPARVRVLALPVHRIKRSRFMTFFNALAAISEVRLGDVSADPRPDRNMFSPLHFPNGVLLYDFMTSEPPQSHLVLSPFELFREPFVVLGLADWALLGQDPNQTSSTELSNGHQCISLNDFETVIGNLREKYPRVLVHNVLLFDSPAGIACDGAVEGLIHVPPAEQRKTTSMRTIICDITSKLLAEMTTLARSIQALPTITSPTQNPKSLNGLPISQRFRDATLVRANSFNTGRARSASPAIGDDIHSHRMSMPVVASAISATSTPTGGSRPTSPDFGLKKPPARTFEEITANSEVEQQMSAEARSTNQDRVSIHGFGSGSLDEWNRNKGQCRIGIVIAGLYLQAGRWYDAMKEFVDNAIRARSSSDHLWHAKALEGILVCIILLAWLRLEFHIPPICYPIPDRSSSSKTTQSTPAASTSDVSSRSADLQALARMIPDLANMILSIYARPLIVTGEALPELAFSESTIRLAKTLASIHLAGGLLNDHVLQHIVHGATLNVQGPPLGTCRLTITPSRPSIEVLLSKAFPEAGEASDLSPLDRIMIMAGIASVLSTLGLQRKKSMMTKECIDALTAAINENKKIGAAQAGVHPTLSLPSYQGFTGDSESPKFSSADDSQYGNGLAEFLNTLCRVYGIPETKWSEDVGFEILRADATNDTDEVVKRPQEATVNERPHLDQLVGNFILRSFGSINIKADILRSCIQLCEAISDIQGLLHYAAALLRTAGPGVALSFDNGDSLIALSREEQISLINLINKTTADSKLVGMDAEAEFWDEFLVRGLYVLGPSPNLSLRRQKQSDLMKTKSKRGSESTFKMVHDPFATKEVEEKDEPLVANEEREFVVILQNPYEFEVHIEHIKIFSETSVVASSKHSFVLRPSRTQSFSVTGGVPKPGTIRVDSCMVKIKCCRERRFSIFSENWSPAADIKIKNLGLLKFRSVKSRPQSDESTSSQVNQTAYPSFPSPSIITLSVIPDQPRLIILEKPIAQSALMLLEGERKKISVTLHNASDVAVDFLHIAFQDTASAIMEEAVANKTLSPPELHECEHQLSRLPAVRRFEEPSLSISPQETKTFDFEVLGKPGLTHANIVFHYANIATAHTEDNNIFFSRQISVSYSITVNASIQLHRFDILPFAGGLRRINDTKSFDDDRSAGHFSTTKTHRGLINHIQAVSQSASANEWCLASLDLRNGWPAPIHASVRLELLDDMANKKSTLTDQTVQELIQPGHVSRFILLIPKIYLLNCRQRIKPINPENERQFVVSTGTEPEAEIMMRELFWYREAVLGMLRGSWTVEGNDRQGNIDLRALRLNSRMLDILRLDDLAIEFQILDAKEEKLVAQSQSTPSTFDVRVEQDLVFRVKIKNRSDKTIFPLLRIRPSWAHQPSDQALDLAKRLTWDGVLQRQLDPIDPGEITFTDTSMCVTCSGELEVGASIEEYRLCKSTAKDEKEVGRSRAGTGEIPDSIADIQGRRTWTANQPCRIDAKDS